MKDQRKKEIRKGRSVIALIGAGVQMVGQVNDITTEHAVIGCEFSLPIVPGEPPTCLVAPDGTRCGKPKGKPAKSFVDQSGKQVHIGDSICCLMNFGTQVLCVVTDLDPGSVGARIGGTRGHGVAMTQVRSGYITMAGEFLLPLDGRASVLYLEPEGKEDDSQDSGILVVKN